ncbi:hypothetical protein MP638_002348 [Amoeboaphelidium occidentale]|nr:hypothetical protein MP638_002348 [Amoeboaphelidium occidentale]
MDFDASDILSVLIERNCNDLDETLLESLYDPYPLKSWKNVYLALYHKKYEKDLHGTEYCIPDYLSAALLDQISLAKQAAIRYPFRSYLGSIPLQPERSSFSCTYSALLTGSVVRSFDSFDSAIVPSARFQPLYQQDPLTEDLFRHYHHNNNYDNYRMYFQVAME